MTCIQHTQHPKRVRRTAPRNAPFCSQRDLLNENSELCLKEITHLAMLLLQKASPLLELYMLLFELSGMFCRC
jgi:hypothetical protein